MTERCTLHTVQILSGKGPYILFPVSLSLACAVRPSPSLIHIPLRSGHLCLQIQKLAPLVLHPSHRASCASGMFSSSVPPVPSVGHVCGRPLQRRHVRREECDIVGARCSRRGGRMTQHSGQLRHSIHDGCARRQRGGKRRPTGVRENGTASPVPGPVPVWWWLFTVKEISTSPSTTK